MTRCGGSRSDGLTPVRSRRPSVPGNRTITIRPATSAERRRRPRGGCTCAVGENHSDRVGGFALRIVPAEESPESRQRWEQRSEALAAWLLSRWREQYGPEGRN